MIEPLTLVIGLAVLASLKPTAAQVRQQNTPDRTGRPR